jgi:superfamily II DNA helicase RecQ
VQDIVKGRYRVILVSPESLLSPRFIKAVLSKAEFIKKVLSVVIDEAHCVSLYGAGFRKLYGSLSMIRNFLPQGMPIVALSATLTPQVHLDLVKRLEFPPNYVFVNEGNDRNNVTLVVRKCIHPLDSYRDTRFVIPPSVRAGLDILKTFLYVDSIDASTGIVDYLTGLLPDRLQDQGLIRPYNATFSADYRRDVMELFREGVVRVLVCTDAAGMVSRISINCYTETYLHFAGLQYSRCRSCCAVAGASKHRDVPTESWPNSARQVTHWSCRALGGAKLLSC